MGKPDFKAAAFGHGLVLIIRISIVPFYSDLWPT